MKELVDMLLESVDRLVNFSKKALEITNIQTKGGAQEKIELNVNPIIENIIELEKDKAETKSIVLLQGDSLQCEPLFRKAGFKRVDTGEVEH